MKLFHYNPISRVHTHTTNAQENPRDKGKYFEQANSTFEAPPQLNSKEAAKRDITHSKWLVVEDHRGKIWDTKTKESNELTDTGPIPHGKTNLEPSEFDTWDGKKWLLDEAKQLTDAKYKANTSITNFATQCRKKIAGNTDYLQTAAWSEKARRAERITADQATETDINIITAEISYRGKAETPKALAQKQLDKADVFANATAVIDGMTAAALSAVDAATNLKQVEELLKTLETKASAALIDLTT